MQDVYQLVYVFSLICIILLYIFRRFVLEIKNDFAEFKNDNDRINIAFYLFVGIMLVGQIFQEYDIGLVILLLGYLLGFIYFLCVKLDNIVWGIYTLYIRFSFGVLLTIYAFLMFIKYNLSLWECGCLIIVFVWCVYFIKIISLWRKDEFLARHIISYMFLMMFMLFEIYFFLGILLEADLYPDGRGDKNTFDCIVDAIGNTIYVSSGSPLLGANTRMVLACIITQATNVLTTTLLLGFFVTILRDYMKDKHIS